MTILRRINVTKNELSYPTLDEVIDIIRSGELVLFDQQYGYYRLKDAVGFIRKMPDEERQYWKFRLLPAVAYNGDFDEVNGKHLRTYSNITAIDFDHIPTEADMMAMQAMLTSMPCVVCVFVTPSGHGLKALVRHDNTDPARHSEMYAQLLNSFNAAGKDVSCKDLSRRNYLSYDPNIWVRQTPSIPFHYQPVAVDRALGISTGSKTVRSGSSIISIMNKKWQKKHPEYWKEGHRATGIFTMSCMLCRWGVDENLATRYFVNGWKCESMTEKEIKDTVHNAYNAENDNFGTVPFTIF